MAINELYSKRQKKLRGETQDVYQYDNLPKALRVQIAQIIMDTIGIDGRDNWGHHKNIADFYQYIHKAIAKEYGVFKLKGSGASDKECVLNFFLEADDVEDCLNVVDFIFNTLKDDPLNGLYNNRHASRSTTPLEAINELNYRFKEHGVGFQFVGNEILKVDSEYLHSEVVVPILTLFFNDSGYKGAEQEFLIAHEHYRHQRHKECLVECLKSLESTIKCICTKRGWAFNQNDTAKTLIDVIFQNGLVPTYMQSEFNGLRALLESGIPPLRNKTSAHGQGVTPITVPESLASYALHLTATNILFLSNLEAGK